MHGHGCSRTIQILVVLAAPLIAPRPSLASGGCEVASAWAAPNRPNRRQPDAPNARERLDLVWSDPAQALPCSFDDVGREVTRIFQRVGVDVTWRPLGTRDAAPPEIMVVFLDAGPPGSVPVNAMGATHRDQRRQPALWVLLCSVRRALGLDPTSGRAAHGFPKRLFARALGRVVAHEAIHILAPAHPHATQGLMHHCLGRSDLLKADLSLGLPTYRGLLFAPWNHPSRP